MAFGNEYDCVGELGVCSWIESAMTHTHTNTHWVVEGVPAVWCATADQSGAGDVSYVRR